MEPDGTGYIRLNRFARKTHEDFVKAAEALLDQGMKRLVLDLRGNGGGYLNAAIGICNELLPAGSIIVYTSGRASPRNDHVSKGGGLLTKIPLVLMIDEGSASASEIVAGAVQDNDRGMIVGRRSFGKGLVQEHIELNDRSAVRITTARYYTPSGRCIQRPYGEGIDYDDDLSLRADHGEFLSPDSIHLDRTKPYKTLKGRTVYGGGGIMPDVFVGADTTDRSSYLNELFFSGVITQTAFDLADSQRERLKAAYGSPQAFLEKYVVSGSDLDKLVQTAREQGIHDDGSGMARSKSIISERLKAGIARNIWQDEGYYRILLRSDPVYKAAREAFTNL
jgi:carboxyl-terminal processing protease